MRRRRARIVLGLLLLPLLLMLAPSATEARPGGGHSYSGRGGHGGAGGDELAGDVIVFLIRLVFYHPRAGIPILILVIVAVAIRSRFAEKTASWDAGTIRTRAGGLDDIRRLDPDFSAVLFEDFACALYARSHEARSSPEAMARLAPYLAPAARGHLQGRQPEGSPVRAAVVGSMSVTDVLLPAASAEAGFVQVGLEVEANLAVDAPDGALTQYVREAWRFARSARARTRPWKGARSFACPACGAPFESSAHNRCGACGQVVDNGQFDWLVRRIDLLALEARPPAITGTVPERGTTRPTVFQPGWQARWDALLASDPSLTGEAFEARLRLVFRELQSAWSALDLAPVRPFTSDALRSSLQYWIDAYSARGLRNVVERAALVRWTVVKMVRDRHYDAVTVRLWGTGRDYTLEAATGKIVGGDHSAERPYSEYWTLIRGARVRGAPRADKSCPSCGAPLKINMAGNCEYCGVLVTTGDFDWVLSRIEQDDSYSG